MVTPNWTTVKVFEHATTQKFQKQMYNGSKVFPKAPGPAASSTVTEALWHTHTTRQTTSPHNANKRYLKHLAVTRDDSYVAN